MARVPSLDTIRGYDNDPIADSLAGLTGTHDVKIVWHGAACAGKIRNTLWAVVQKAGRVVRDDAKRYVSTPAGKPNRNKQGKKTGGRPKLRTGRLRDSIQMTVTPTELTVSVGSDVDYAVFLEMGTSKMSPRPWLLPSLQLARPKIERMAKDTFARLP